MTLDAEKNTLKRSYNMSIRKHGPNSLPPRGGHINSFSKPTGRLLARSLGPLPFVFRNHGLSHLREVAAAAASQSTEVLLRRDLLAGVSNYKWNSKGAL